MSEISCLGKYLLRNIQMKAAKTGLSTLSGKTVNNKSVGDTAS